MSLRVAVVAAVAAVSISVGVSGCSFILPQEYVKADEVTLPQAMKDLACGLATLRNESARLHMYTGTMVDQIEISLDLKASATGSSTLVVDAKPTLPASVATLGINYSNKSEVIGARGNTIKITLKGLATANVNDAGKEALRRSGLNFVDPRLLYPLEDPCNPPVLSPDDRKSATRINSPTTR